MNRLKVLLFITIHSTSEETKDQRHIKMPPPTFWDPRLLLDCYPLRENFKCTGTTKKGARCGQTFIENKSKSDSDRVLSILSSKDIIANGLDDRIKNCLRILAELTLCPRWHRGSQSNTVYLKWFQTINIFITEERSRIQILREQIRRPIRAPEPVRPVPAVQVMPRERPILHLEPARVAASVPVVNEERPRQPRDNVSFYPRVFQYFRPMLIYCSSLKHRSCLCLLGERISMHISA
jgi:hypothetical protein